MDQDSVYTNDEVVEMAERVADSIVDTDSAIRRYMYNSDEWKKGPLAMFNGYSKRHNPKGNYPVSVELLTYKQKSLVAEIVGNAMAEAAKGKK